VGVFEPGLGDAPELWAMGLCSAAFRLPAAFFDVDFDPCAGLFQ
jgi:hypothetical protein